MSHVVSTAGQWVALSTWDSLVAGVNTCPSIISSAILGPGICKLHFLRSSAIWLPLRVHWMEIRRWESREISVAVAATGVE